MQQGVAATLRLLGAMTLIWSFSGGLSASGAPL
jgi:hypothetical protein